MVDLDVFREAGGAHKALVKEFKDVEVTGDIDLEFSAKAGEPMLSGLEIVRK